MIAMREAIAFAAICTFNLSLYAAPIPETRIGDDDTASTAVHPFKRPGSVLGVGGGLQTSGGSFGERWVVQGAYEYQFKGAASIPFELEVLRVRTLRADKDYYQTNWMASTGLKISVDVVGLIRINVQAGGGVGNVSLASLFFCYGVGLDINLGSKFTLEFAVKNTSYYPDLDMISMVKIGMRIP